MKFLLVKDLKNDSYFKPIISALLIFTISYLVIDIFVKHNSIGITVSSLLNTFFGNEEEYIDPMELSIFLEFWHMDIFFIMMLLLTLSAVYIRLCKASKQSLFISNVNIISALVTLLSVAVSYFYISSFIYLYIFSFYLWHILSIYISLISLYKLYRE